MIIRYINLENNFDKNQRMQMMLSNLKLDKFSDRFPGVLTLNSLNGLSKSETGCLLAHQSLLMSLSTDQTTIILEDDVKLSNDFPFKIKKLIENFESSQLDLIFLGQTVLPQDVLAHRNLLKFFENSSSLNTNFYLDASKFYRFGAFAYVVNGKSINKINKLFKSMNLSTDAKAIDVLLGRWIRQGLLRATVLFPYLAGVDFNLTSSMHDRTNALRHRRYAELANLYCRDYSNNSQEKWLEIISNQPNERALDICMALYLTLTEK